MSDSNKKKNYHEGHRNRVRARIKADPEMQAFAPHELLEFILFHTVPRKDTNELAHQLIDTFGSFAGVLDASIEDLSNVKGMTENSAYLIKSIIPISRAYSLDKQQRRTTLSTSFDVKSYFSSYFVNRSEEALYAIYMDINYRVLSVVNIGKNQNASSIELDVKKLQQTAIANNATHIIIMHNHPGDNIYPSDSDIITTNLALVLLYSLRISLDDHIIFGNNGRYFSFYQNNIMEMLAANCKKFLSFDVSGLYKGKRKIVYDNDGILLSENENKMFENFIGTHFKADDKMKADLTKTLEKAKTSTIKTFKK